jgi:pyruvate kinase
MNAKKDYNRTKILTTLGPATSSYEAISNLIKAGADVMRLNLSHGKHDDLKKIIENIRRYNEENNDYICILCDLQGPKLRIGEFIEGSVFWSKGDKVIFTSIESPGTKEQVYMNYKEFPKDVKPGDKVMLDDGKIELVVDETNGVDKVVATVVYGGEISSKKGVNLPNTKISLPSLTEKDLRDLDFALENDVEWIGLSFVRTPEDVVDLKARIANAGSKARVIAKIEKPEAIINIDEIIKETDAIMVARGDLGVEVPMQEVPVLQKNIVRKCQVAAKPVIIATQMMESMITNPRPTRAETNDVANAVLDGADAVMLSGETSVGKYPELAVSYMDLIIRNVEKEKAVYNAKYSLNKNSETFISDAVCLNAVLMSKEVVAKAVISMTKSGYTAFKIASYRPEAKIQIFSDDKHLLRTINLIWGVRGFYYDKFTSTDETFSDVIEILKKEGFVNSGELVINTASMPIKEKSRTNALKVSIVD